jgi:hypothetical protein
MFTDASLSWVSSSGSSSYNFAGEIGPGFSLSDFGLQFPDTVTFSSVTFSATLSPTSFQLGDDPLFEAVSSSLLASLTSPTGTLAPGDFVILSVDANEVIAPVPEPSTVLLLATGFAGSLLVRKRSKRRHH